MDEHIHTTNCIHSLWQKETPWAVRERNTGQLFCLSASVSWAYQCSHHTAADYPDPRLLDVKVWSRSIWGLLNSSGHLQSRPKVRYLFQPPITVMSSVKFGSTSHFDVTCSSVVLASHEEWDTSPYLYTRHCCVRSYWELKHLWRTVPQGWSVGSRKITTESGRTYMKSLSDLWKYKQMNICGFWSP